MLETFGSSIYSSCASAYLITITIYEVTFMRLAIINKQAASMAYKIHKTQPQRA